LTISGAHISIDGDDSVDITADEGDVTIEAGEDDDRFDGGNVLIEANRPGTDDDVGAVIVDTDRAFIVDGTDVPPWGNNVGYDT